MNRRNFVAVLTGLFAARAAVAATGSGASVQKLALSED
jgi:hypothetical protein